jgi:hypothetical protein
VRHPARTGAGIQSLPPYQPGADAHRDEVLGHVAAQRLDEVDRERVKTADLLAGDDRPVDVRLPVAAGSPVRPSEAAGRRPRPPKR